MRLRRLITVVATVLWVVIAVLWIVSEFRADQWVFARGRETHWGWNTLVIESKPGWLSFEYQWGDYPGTPQPPDWKGWHFYHQRPQEHDLFWLAGKGPSWRLGINAYQYSEGEPPVYCTTVMVLPYAAALV